jgi:hypothetical protein
LIDLDWARNGGDLRASDFGLPSGFGLRPSDFWASGDSKPERRIKIKIMNKKGKNPTPPYPRTDRQVVRIPTNIGPKSLSNRQPLDNNVKDRRPDEKIREFLSNFTMSINNKPSANRQEASANRQIPVRILVVLVLDYVTGFVADEVTRL